ncbi:MAG: 6-phospho-beta-glucosidase [Streptosporangiaceae bacterium]
MKLTILGGGGVRMPAFVRSVLTGGAHHFDEICLLEPDQVRRDTTGRLAVELAAALGRPGSVTVTPDAAQALTGADFVFSALRVGGDRGRVIDEQVALQRGVVGQETTGPGGFAMAMRTIPVVLSYCELLHKYAPDATLINFTNPAGLITQAICDQGLVRAVGVCDTPGGTIEHLATFLRGGHAMNFGYSGLNHLGWITSAVVDGEDRLGELLDRFTELQAFDHRFAAFDPSLVRTVGALPTEYVFYYYDPERYLRSVAAAGASRGQDILRLNDEMLTAVGKAFADGDVHDAWAAYARLLGVRRDTYMRTDMEGASGQDEARARQAAQPHPALDSTGVGGYEGLALRVIDGLTGRRNERVIVNVPNDGGVIGALDRGDIVEVPSEVTPAGLAPVPVPDLPRSARALVEQVKEYERTAVRAAMSGDADLAAVALALHPLVPGSTVARELLAAYREQHGQSLAYLN